MLVINENRYQYVYFVFSGLVTSAIIILAYISIRTTVHDKFRDDIKIIQSSLTLLKPATSWHYNNSWKHIGNSSRGHEIYSAYFDMRTDVIDTSESIDYTNVPIGSLRIFAILPTMFKDTIQCIVRFDDFTLKYIKAAEVKSMHESHEKPFAAFTIMCPLYVSRNISTVQLPQAVALSYATNRLSSLSPTFIEISYARNMTLMFQQTKPTIAACVGPLQFHYNEALRVAEFVEMYRILGVTHFYFYVMDATDEVKQLLAHYRDIGLADVLSWNIHKELDDVHYGGIVAQYNDCVFRAMVVDNFRYAAVIDFDEIIVPLKHNSLMHYLRQCDEGRTSGFVFRNVFFYKKDSNDTFSIPSHIKNRFLYTQTKVRRTVEIMPAYDRSKCIVNTRAIVEMGNHNVWRSAPGYSDSIVHQTVGLLFHYRDHCINCKAILVVDYTARRFGSLLWDRVDRTCLEVFIENGGICPMS
ncbi:uncharacterized protein LOC119685783 [Teleopsis dalmanni]|uniref:uncharacterized protein LOC119685783 n=1 Tax=Teleopsis dalmanni TaxID=139649 RepID=UPI0018CD5C34|nr:uncharacterized protein LOC119685783 [Teleopsis dalmanni]